MTSADTRSRGVFSSRPRRVNRDMNSWQTKLGSFSENWNATALALSIKASAGVNGRVDTESAGGDAAGHGGKSGAPRFKVGGSSEQGGVLWVCDWASNVPKARAKPTTVPAKGSQRWVERDRFTFFRILAYRRQPIAVLVDCKTKAPRPVQSHRRPLNSPPPDRSIANVAFINLIVNGSPGLRDSSEVLGIKR